MQKQQILDELKQTFETLFEIPSEQVSLESRLYEDLDLDSIDAVDLIVHLKQTTNMAFNPEEFKAVKTVSDVVHIIDKKISENKISKTR
ncbi:MAG: acyl carrier protein [Francisellaceae bacterium]